MDSGTLYSNGSSTNQIITQSYLSSSGIPSSSTDYILPRQVGTGSTRGTQTIGVGNINIDGSDNQISITNGSNNSSIILGQQSTVSNQAGVAASSFTSSNGGFGLSVTDSNNASINLGINSNGNVELLFNDGTNNRLLVDSEVINISKPGVEVTTASLAQLAFSSSASYTVLLQSSYTFPSFGSVAAGVLNGGSFTTIPHNAGFTPNVNCFTPLVFPGVTFAAAPSGFPISDISLITNGSAITQISNISGDAFFNFFYTIDETNLYIGATFQNGTSATVIASPLIINYTVFALNATGS